MPDKKELCKKATSFDSDLSMYDIDIDIDIDFELNDGKGAWVVLLQKNDRHLQRLSDINATNGGKDGFHNI